MCEHITKPRVITTDIFIAKDKNYRLNVNLISIRTNNDESRSIIAFHDCH